MNPYNIKEGWRIAADKRSYKLQRSRTVKGEQSWRTEGYFVSLEDCLKGYLQRQVLESSADLPTALRESLQALQAAMDQLKTSLTVTL